MEVVETASGQRGTRCTVGLNTPAIITGGLPLIILLDEEEGKADVKQPHFTEDTNSGTRPKTTTKRVAGDETKTTGRQDPMIPGRSAESETSLGTRPKIVGAKLNVDSERQAHLTNGAVIGGSSPATGTIENLLATLNFDFQKYPQNFVIRAYGFNQHLRPVYGIMKYVDGHVMGTFAVNEKAEKVDLKDNTGLDLLTASGGLKHPRGRMNIALPSNQQIAVIDKDEIHFNSDNTTFTLRSCIKQNKENYIIYHQEKSQVCISEHEDSVKLETHTKLSNVQFAIALLHALQVLYKHDINKRAMPSGILIQKPPKTYKYFKHAQHDLSVLKTLGGLVLRMACRINSDHWFADFLSIPHYRQRIMLILTKSNDRYEFSETSGAQHFVARRDEDIISVCTACSSLPFGKINMNSGECYDRNDALQMYIFERPKMTHPQPEHRLNKNYVIYAPDRVTQIAAVQSLYYMTSIGFNQEESRNCKAMIIAYASVIAETEHGISEQTVPKVQKYPY